MKVFYIISLLMFLLLSSSLTQARTTLFYPDATGTAVMATDENGRVLWKRPPRGDGRYPEVHPMMKKMNHRMTVAGHYHDWETGLVYTGRRYFDPKTMRFLGPDPVKASPTNIHQFNSYAFVANNPYRYVDPDGRRFIGSAQYNFNSGNAQQYPDPNRQIDVQLQKQWPLGIRKVLGGAMLAWDVVSLFNGRFVIKKIFKSSFKRRGLNSSDALSGVERALTSLINSISAKRSVNFAEPGSEEMRYLNYIGAEANVGGEMMTHILLQKNPSKAAILEEFLHGTQFKLGIIDKLGVSKAEAHVKSFMIRHQRMLGLSVEDIKRLQILKDAGL